MVAPHASGRDVLCNTYSLRCVRAVRFEQIVAGRDFFAAVTTQGHVYTWGNGEFGQLGHQENNSKKAPKKISALRELEIPVELATCGYDFMMFTSKESDDDSQFNTQKPGVFMCMGSNAQAQLGDGTGKNQWIPQLLNKEGPSHTSVSFRCSRFAACTRRSLTTHTFLISVFRLPTRTSPTRKTFFSVATSAFSRPANRTPLRSCPGAMLRALCCYSSYSSHTCMNSSVLFRSRT